MKIGEVLFAVFSVVEISEILCFVLVVVEDLRQGFVAVFVGVDLGVAAFVSVLLN